MLMRSSVLQWCFRARDDGTPSTSVASNNLISLEKLAHPTGFEPVTSAFGGQRSIQLSYGCQPEPIARFRRSETGPDLGLHIRSRAGLQPASASRDAQDISCAQRGRYRRRAVKPPAGSGRSVPRRGRCVPWRFCLPSPRRPVCGRRPERKSRYCSRKPGYSRS